MEKTLEEDVFNIASGCDYTVESLSKLIKHVVGFEGDIVFDVSKPEGVLVKLQDISKITKLGWKHSISLEEGIRRTYFEDVQSNDQIRSNNDE